ncbi:hypothetical protein BZG36_03701 [Bifiguratus adelaidae]|uniref:Uncharacterized protein n=1 Tax=Bifiguratus adelaidae TaxID=1938954 RepID=A0A261XZ41_9FUNG|nr:hypothetical protein BZG36_03701 [Bifiguratus adelaidae]
MRPDQVLPYPLKNRYILQRHGRSEANEAGLICSHPLNGIPAEGGPKGNGYGLTESGRKQVFETATRMSDHLFPSSLGTLTPATDIYIYTSPFLRTVQTAQIIHSVLSSTASVGNHLPEPIPTISLRERAFGTLELGPDSAYEGVWKVDNEYGLAQSDYQLDAPLQHFVPNEDGTESTVPDPWPYHPNHPNDVESPPHVRARAVALIRELEAKHQGANLILVMHGDIVQILQTAFVTGDMEAWRHRQLTHVGTGEWRDMGHGQVDPDTITGPVSGEGFQAGNQ